MTFHNCFTEKAFGSINNYQLLQRECQLFKYMFTAHHAPSRHQVQIISFRANDAGTNEQQRLLTTQKQHNWRTVTDQRYNVQLGSVSKGNPVRLQLRCLVILTNKTGLSPQLLSFFHGGKNVKYLKTFRFTVKYKVDHENMEKIFPSVHCVVFFSFTDENKAYRKSFSVFSIPPVQQSKIFSSNSRYMV